MHKHWFTFDISEISCKILICINDLFLYICLLVMELSGSHQHSLSSICDIRKQPIIMLYFEYLYTLYIEQTYKKRFTIICLFINGI